jgi:hypothetical protein
MSNTAMAVQAIVVPTALHQNTALLFEYHMVAAVNLNLLPEEE